MFALFLFLLTIPLTIPSCRLSFFFFFFFNDTATTEIYTLSLHDALPISDDAGAGARPARGGGPRCADRRARVRGAVRGAEDRAHLGARRRRRRGGGARARGDARQGRLVRAPLTRAHRRRARARAHGLCGRADRARAGPAASQ